MSNTNTNTEWFTETTLAERTGAALTAVRDARERLIPPSEIKKEGRRVSISREAAEMLCGVLGADIGCLDSAGEKKEAGGAHGSDGADCVEVVAKKIPMNPKLVIGEVFGGVVRVRVPDAQKFVPGMKLRARWVAGDLYQLVGRGPRYKGRY